MAHLPHAPAFALAALILTSPDGSAFANCEPGGYMIRTVAEYAELGESGPSFLRIESADSDGFRVVQVATAAPPRLEELQTATPSTTPGGASFRFRARSPSSAA